MVLRRALGTQQIDITNIFKHFKLTLTSLLSAHQALTNYPKYAQIHHVCHTTKLFIIQYTKLENILGCNLYRQSQSLVPFTISTQLYQFDFFLELCNANHENQTSRTWLESMIIFQN